MQPIRTNILFKPFPSKEISEGGLYVPESARQINNKGTIVAVGNKVSKVKVGDIGFRVKDWGDEVLINGEKHFIMDENAIIAKV